MDSYRPVILFIILISLHVGYTLHCACKEDLRNCTRIYHMQVDFKTAQEMCMANGGKLLRQLSDTVASLLFNTTGHFWIGTESNCLSPATNSPGNSQLTSSRGGKEVECSARCVSVSSSREMNERSCEEPADGFLCDGIQWENCWADKPSEVLILHKEGCRLGPCEHHCEDVPGGHMCFCFESYRPSRTDPKRCEYYCASATCEPACPSCNCPEGFIKDERQCADIDECTSNYNDCAGTCTNTIGSYTCSCPEGFMLVNVSKCVPRPSVHYASSRAALATPAKYGLIVFIVLKFGLHKLG